MKFQGQCQPVTSNEKFRKMNGISAGSVSVKTRFRDAKHDGISALMDIFTGCCG